MRFRQVGLMLRAEKASKSMTRIQRQKSEQILTAALDAFSTYGFNGASINVIAQRAKLTTPNLLYYFPSKDAIRRELLERALHLWMAPLSMINPKGDPVEEIGLYVKRKLEVSKNFPRESKFFAHEVLRGLAEPREEIFRALKNLYRVKLAMIEDWIKQGKIAPVDPHHLMYSIWATTQHYADFEAQIREVTPEKYEARFQDAEVFLTEMYEKLLRPQASGGALRSLPAPPEGALAPVMKAGVKAAEPKARRKPVPPEKAADPAAPA